MFLKMECQNIKCFSALNLDIPSRKQGKSLVVGLGAGSGGKTVFIQALSFLNRCARLEEQIWIAEHQDMKIRTVLDLTIEQYLKSWSGTQKDCLSLISYEIQISRTIYRYSFAFDHDGTHVEEFLEIIRDREILEVFFRNESTFRFNERFFSEAQTKDLNREVWQKNTPLLVMMLVRARFSETWKTTSQLKDLRSLLQFFTTIEDASMYCAEESEMFHGTMELHQLPALKAREKLLQGLCNYLWPDNMMVSYRVDRRSQQLGYRLMIKRVGELKFSEQLSERQIKRVLLCQAIIAALGGRNVLIDDLDAMLDFQAVQGLLERFSLQTKGQLIVTIHSTHPLVYLSGRQVYFIDYRRLEGSVIGLNQLMKTQRNNNNRIRYEKGVFGLPKRENIEYIQNLSDDYFALNDYEI